MTTSTMTGTVTAAGIATSTSVLSSGITTTTKTVGAGATNTTTGGPAVFTGAAAANNAMAGLVFAGALAAMSLNFL